MNTGQPDFMLLQNTVCPRVSRTALDLSSVGKLINVLIGFRSNTKYAKLFFCTGPRDQDQLSNKVDIPVAVNLP